MKTIKKIGAIALTAVMAVTALTGCGKKLSGTVATDGSTSMEKVIGALGEQFEKDKQRIQKMKENRKFNPVLIVCLNIVSYFQIVI